MSFNLKNNEQVLDWKAGASESVILAILSFFVFGIFILLADFERLLLNPTTILYTIILLLGIVTNLDALMEIEVTKKGLVTGVGWGFICLLLLSVIGIVFNQIPGFTLLEVPPLGIDMEILGKIAYQLTFVAFSEELVFRNSLPRLFSGLLKDVTKNNALTLAISFEVSSFLFGIVHFFAYGGNMLQVLIAFIAGNILSLFRIVGNLFSSTFAHLLYNVTSISLFSLSPQLGGGTTSSLNKLFVHLFKLK
jgi:membrane protease YdiL (CAAX protease family)